MSERIVRDQGAAILENLSLLLADSPDIMYIFKYVTLYSITLITEIWIMTIIRIVHFTKNWRFGKEIQTKKIRKQAGNID